MAGCASSRRRSPSSPGASSCPSWMAWSRTPTIDRGRSRAMRWTRFLVAALVLGAALAGCGGPQQLKTRGRVLKGGAPFLPGQGEFVRVTFVPVLPAGQRVQDYYVAEYDNQ